MKQFQFEVKSHNNLRRELARVKRFCDNEYYTSVFFEIFTQLDDAREIKEITDIIDHEFPDSYYYGCSTSGNIYEGKLSEQRTLVVGTVFELPSTTAKSFYIDPQCDDAKYKTLQDVWDFCNENSWVKSVEIISSGRGAELLGIGNPIGNLRDDVIVLGGIANVPDSETDIFAKDYGMSKTAAMAVALGGEDIHIESSYIRGWEGLGKSFTITDCEGKQIKTIDDEPAMNIYRKYLNIEQNERFEKNTIAFPLLVEYDGVECIREVSLVEENMDYIGLSCVVNKGQRVRLSYGDKPTILAQDKSKLPEIAEFSPDVVRVYSCSARKEFWGDEDISQETTIFDEIAPTVGFYTGGEILRIGNYLHLFNCTVVYCLLREGEAYGQDCIEDDDCDNSIDVGIVPNLITYLGAVTNEFEGQYSTTMRGIAQIYKSMLLIDLENRTITQLDSDETLARLLSEQDGYEEKMNHIIEQSIVEPMISVAKEFFDFSTLQNRLEKKNTTYSEFILNKLGWIGAQIIVINRDNNGILTRVVFTVQIIDDEKKKEQKLVKNANTDPLTGLYNRRAYEKDINVVKTNGIGDYDFVMMGIDINGLKTVNDSQGHDVGDEIVTGAADCIKRCLAPYGKAYRIGGDEFAVVIYADRDKLDEIIEDFDQAVLDWRGQKIEYLTVSYGCAFSDEATDDGIEGLIKLADKRMYEAKEAYYKNKGVDRRAQKSSFDSMCQSYVKVLKVNLSTDSFEVIKAVENELSKEFGYDEDKFSRWLQGFAFSGIIHPEDREKFVKRTGMVYLREYFNGGYGRYTLRYRRRVKGIFREVLMELIPAKEFEISNKMVYLYVKDITEE